MTLKAYELLESTPGEINGFKKVIYDNLKEDYPFELNSNEEVAFYETLQEGYDDEQFLWYENDKKAYSLYVTLNEDGKVEFVIKDMIVLWTDEDGETEYDTMDETPEIFDCFEDAVEDFLDFLEKY